MWVVAGVCTCRATTAKFPAYRVKIDTNKSVRGRRGFRNELGGRTGTRDKRILWFKYIPRISTRTPTNTSRVSSAPAPSRTHSTSTPSSTSSLEEAQFPRTSSRTHTHRLGPTRNAALLHLCPPVVTNSCHDSTLAGNT